MAWTDFGPVEVEGGVVRLPEPTRIQLEIPEREL
ncbi:hypothetical protein ABTM35_19735, partial [Acinetobacter baumannii]